MLNEEIIIQTDSSGRKKQKYIKKQQIGSGGFAKCYLVVNTKNNEKLAAKVIDSRQLKDKSSRNKILQEVQIHKQMEHKYIVKFFDMFEFEGQMFLIMELCQNNSLKEFIRSRVRITEFEAKCYLHQIIEGMEYIHQKNIVHRDIKLGNLFLNYKMEVKIGDFGLSTKLKNPRQRKFTTCGTPNYIAPEILRETGHSFQADIWALGIILYAMLIGKPPFESDSVQNTYKKIKSNSYQFPKHIPVSEEAKSLIKAILEPNPKNRFTLDQIKKHDFLNKETQKIPRTMPPYTISIPPQSNYLKQYVSEKSMKLSIYPRKLNEKRPSMMDEYAEKGEDGSKVKKMNRVVSADKNMLKNILHTEYSKQISSLNRGRYIKALRAQSLSKGSKKQVMKSVIPKTQRPIRLTSPRKYEQDGTQIICYYDMSQKYGIGYLLSNGNYGVSFNDGTSLTKISSLPEEGAKKLFNYIYYSGHETLLNSIPQNLNKKKEILKLCQQKLESYRQHHILIPYYSQVYVKKWLKFKSCFVLKMSNSILQFFWDSDSVTLKGYKWIKWRIDEQEGEGAISQKNLSVHTHQKIEEVREFLRKFSEQSKKKEGQ